MDCTVCGKTAVQTHNLSGAFHRDQTTSLSDQLGHYNNKIIQITIDMPKK